MRCKGFRPRAPRRRSTRSSKRVQARGLPILLAGMEAPRNMGKDYVEEFARDLCRSRPRYDVLFYPFFLEGAALNDGLMQADGIHPNAKGVAVIVDNICPRSMSC